MLNIKVSGSFLKDVEKHIKNVEKSVQQAVTQATNGLKQELRQQVTGAGLGKRLSNTWRSKVNPQGRNSVNASGAVWTTAREIIDSNSKGATIKGKQGNWLAIPLEAAGKAGRGRKMTPVEWQKKNGRLRFIYGKNGKNSFLVAENMRARKGKRGGFSRASESAVAKGTVATVPVFLVIPQVRIKRRLDPKSAYEKWSRSVITHMKVD